MFGQWFARRRRPTDAEIACELRDHLELEAQERGGDDGPAAAAARRRFGNLTRAGEDVRAVWRSAWWDQFGSDTRIALRTLRRSKAFATFSILALALAITANTTMSSLIDAIVFPRVAFPHPERLVIARFHGSPWYVTAPGNTSPPTATMAAVLGSSGGTYSAATTWPGDDDRTYDIAIQARDQHLHIAAAAAGPGFFATVGARPLYGTLYHDSTAATRHEAVISEGLWRRISGGQTTFAPFEVTALYAGGTDALTVIGVLPHNGAPPLDADLYLPDANWSSDAALIRLRPGATHAQLLTELNALAPRIDRNHSRVARFELEPAIVSPAKHLDLVAALAASTLAVLLIACANIANLLVARGMARSRELATRMALGASRLRVARLLFAESGIVALTGGVLGVLLALWTIHVLSATLPANLQYLGLVQPQLSWRVVAAGMGLTVVAAVVFGVAPVIGLMRADVGTILKGASGRHTTAGRTRFRLLVVAEVAGALTLVVSASMLGAVAGRIKFVDYGYDPANLLVATVGEARIMLGNADGYGRPADARLVAQRYDELQRLRAMPGVVAATAQWPAGASGIRVDDPGGDYRLTKIEASRIVIVEPNYLRTLGMKVIHGRDFHESEDDPIPSVIIDQNAAHWLWPGADPVGRLMQFSSSGPWLRVVGVVGHAVFSVTCMEGPCSEPMILVADGAAYHASKRSTEFVLRTRDNPRAFIARVRQQLAQDYPNVAPSISTWDDFTGFASITRMYDFVGALFGAFAFIGLLLALIGVYGVAAYAVEQRAREFGVRIALGAQARDIIRLVLHDGNATALLGLAVGLVFANWAESLLGHYLFGYDDLAPYFMLGAMVASFAATVLAGIPPALRATRVNPVDTLRAE